jgi:trans-aconitate 2-methyltransferase
MHTWDPCDYERHSVAQESWVRDCLARLRLRGDERILDLGCGDGRVSFNLAALVPVGEVLAVDASPEMIAHAREKHLGAARANLDFAVADATGLANEERFDLVVSFTCLHCVHDQAGCSTSHLDGGSGGDAARAARGVLLVVTAGRPLSSGRDHPGG